MCFTSTETIRLIRDGEKGAKGYGGGLIDFMLLNVHGGEMAY